MNTFEPLHDLVVIRPDALGEETTEGGLVVQRALEVVPTSGVVLAVGPGVLTLMGERVACTVKPGDVVYFAPYGATEMTIDWDGEEDVDVLLWPESALSGYERGAS